MSDLARTHSEPTGKDQQESLVIKQMTSGEPLEVRYLLPPLEYRLRICGRNGSGSPGREQ
jgi:hypothetical protein